MPRPHLKYAASRGRQIRAVVRFSAARPRAALPYALPDAVTGALPYPLTEAVPDPPPEAQAEVRR